MADGTDAWALVPPGPAQPGTRTLMRCCQHFGLLALRGSLISGEEALAVGNTGHAGSSCVGGREIPCSWIRCLIIISHQVGEVNTTACGNGQKKQLVLTWSE